MYVRIAEFENRDMSRVDELIETVRARARSGSDFIVAERLLMLIDRDGGTALGITFFDSKEAIAEAEPTFERLGDEIPEDLRGHRKSVEIYEVLFEDIAEGARAARVSTLEGSPAGIDEGMRFIKDQVIPAAGDISGWRGIIALADRTTGRTKTITLWESAESLRASEARADELRNEAADALGETITSVDRYEVAISEVAAALRA